MLFKCSAFFAAAAALLAKSVLAQENAILAPSAGSEIAAGQDFLIRWSPTTTGSVTLTLRKGDPNNFDTIGTIASGLNNNGSYTWAVRDTLTPADDYAVQITDDTDESTNYSHLFSIVSGSTSSSAAASASAASSSAAPASSVTTTVAAASVNATSPSTTMAMSTTAASVAVNSTVASSTMWSRTNSSTSARPTSSAVGTGNFTTSSNGTGVATGLPIASSETKLCVGFLAVVGALAMAMF
ncbi:hypothetical protein YB2330_003231 [Saitoella coloradoensis]